MLAGILLASCTADNKTDPNVIIIYAHELGFGDTGA